MMIIQAALLLWLIAEVCPAEVVASASTMTAAAYLEKNHPHLSDLIVQRTNIQHLQASSLLAAIPGVPPPPRSLQLTNSTSNTTATTTSASPAYTSRYVGRFSELISNDACYSTGRTSLIVACAGTFTLTKTSHTNIVCKDLPTGTVLDVFSWSVPTPNGALCVSTCADNDPTCEVWSRTNDTDVIDNVLNDEEFGGSIYYECSGNSIDDITSRILLQPTAGSGCNATTPGDTVAHWYILQAGIECKRGSFSSPSYVYDPFYFECDRGYEASFELGFTFPYDIYRCIAFGDGCDDDGRACRTTFDPVYITSDAANVPAACIETTRPITPAPTPAVPASSSGDQYETTFVTTWGVWFLNSTSVCSSDSPTVILECGRGSTIMHNSAVSSLAATTSCSSTSSSTLECTDSRIGPAANKESATVEYTCSGPVVPTTTVRFPATDSRCSAGIEVEAVIHTLQLGIQCDDEFLFDDIYVECQEGGDFANLNETDGVGSRYSCGESQIFLDTTTSTTAKTVTEFSIATDNFWLESPDSACFAFAAATTVVETSAPVPAPTALTPSGPVAPTPAAPSSSVTTSANYKVEYTAEFQHVLQGSCVGPPPEIRVQCTGNIRFLNASLPSISCTKLPQNLLLETYTNGLLCKIDCETAGDCDLYTNSNFNPFRHVAFECSGDRFDDIGAVMQVTQSSGLTYTCPSDETESGQFHVGRLGVTCGTGHERAISFHNALFDCDTFGTAASLPFGDNLLSPAQELGCLKFDSCKINNSCDCTSGLACQLDLGLINIFSDIQNFPKDCIETAAGVTVTPAPSPPPIDLTESGVRVKARYRVNWSLFADDAISSTRCTVNSSVTLVECFHSNITLLRMADSVSCTMESDRLLRCVDSQSDFLGGFTSSVEYVRCVVINDSFLTIFAVQECVGSGPGVPETEARLDKSSAVCNGNQREVRIGHSLQLAPFCDSTGFFYLDSYFIECGLGNQFYSAEVDDKYRYSCAETVVFDIGSTASEPKDLPTTTISTDQQWRDMYLLECVVIENVDDFAMSLAPRAAITIMPANVGIISMPSALIPNVDAPQSAPGSRDIGIVDQAKESNKVGAIVGASVGSVVFLAIAGTVLFYLVCWKPKRKEPVKEVSEHANDHSQTGHSAQADHFANEDEWRAQTPFTPMPLATAVVMPMGVDDNDDVVASKMSKPSTTDLPGSVESGSGSQHRCSIDSQPDTSVRYKDQAQSMIRPDTIRVTNSPDSDGQHRFMYPQNSASRPDTLLNVHNQAQVKMHKTSSVAVAQGSSDLAGEGSGSGSQRPFSNISHPDTNVRFKDQAQSMIRPDTIRVDNLSEDDDNGVTAPNGQHRFYFPRPGVSQPGAAINRYNETHGIRPDTIGIPEFTDSDNNTFASAITEAETRGSSDPSGVYSHEMSLLDPAYGKNVDP